MGSVKDLWPITLLEVIRKALSKIFLNRTKDKINRYLAQSQSAYRKSRSTTDIIRAHRWIIAKTQMQNRTIYVTGMDRSSHQRCSIKKGVLRNFTKFTGKHLCQSLFFNKVAGLRPATLLKKRLWHRYFPVNFVKFLRTPFLQNTSGRLLLYRYVKYIRHNSKRPTNRHSKRDLERG